MKTTKTILFLATFFSFVFSEMPISKAKSNEGCAYYILSGIYNPENCFQNSKKNIDSKICEFENEQILLFAIKDLSCKDKKNKNLNSCIPKDENSFLSEDAFCKAIEHFSTVRSIYKSWYENNGCYISESIEEYVNNTIMFYQKNKQGLDNVLSKFQGQSVSSVAELNNELPEDMKNSVIFYCTKRGGDKQYLSDIKIYLDKNGKPAKKFDSATSNCESKKEIILEDFKR